MHDVIFQSLRSTGSTNAELLVKTWVTITEKNFSNRYIIGVNKIDTSNYQYNIMFWLQIYLILKLKNELSFFNQAKIFTNSVVVSPVSYKIDRWSKQ